MLPGECYTFAMSDTGSPADELKLTASNPEVLTGDGQAPGEMKFSVPDVKALQEFMREFRDAQRSGIDLSLSLLDRSTRIHENAASYYEKLILVDGGTIALSLSLLGALMTRSAGGHVPRQAFEYLVCPAWILLLLSIVLCQRCILAFHNTNVALYRKVAVASQAYENQYQSVLIARFSRLIEGEIRLGEDVHDATKIFSQLSDVLLKAGNDQNQQIGKLIQEASEIVKGMRSKARLAGMATTSALVFLCIFAIRAILYS
jgi:hypothetical protein